MRNSSAREGLEEEEQKPTRRNLEFKPTKAVLIGGVAVVAVISFVLFSLVFKNDESKHLSSVLTEIGRDWYEDFYYDGFEESKRTEILSRYKDSGIKVDLDNLSRYNADANEEKIREFRLDEEDGCSKTETEVLIKPKEPYGKTDYDIEAVLSCNNE